MDNKGMRYPHIAARVFNTPLLIEPGKLNAILGVLSPRMGFDVEGVDVPQLQYSRPDAHLDYMLALGAELETKRMDAGYYLVNGHIAVIPVLGSLVQRSDFMSDMSGMTSYSSLASMFNAAMNDPNVTEIMLELDTPGGEVAGAFDFADMIFNARDGGKLITAVASEQAASAGYLIASAAHEIALPRTGNVGSVGVVAAHMDQSKAMEKKGVAVTLIYAGDKKVDGNSYMPLPDSVKAEWQAEIKDVYGLFVDTVARNLNIGADRVRGTQAGMFMGSKAVDAGLAHRVNTFSNELRNGTLRKRSIGGFYRLGTTEVDKELGSMDTKDAKGGNTHTAEDVNKARAEGHAAGVTEAQAAQASAVQAAVTAERARIQGIVGHAEAEGRAELAQHLAFSTDSTVEAAAGLLKVAAKAGDSKQASALDRAMAGNQPRVSSQEVVAGAQQSPSLDANTIYARRAAQAAAARK